MIRLRLFLKPEIDWNLFLATAKQALDRSLTSEIDARKIAVGDTKSFLMCLRAIRSMDNSDPLQYFKDLPLLETISFGFLFAIDDDELTRFQEQASGILFITEKSVQKGLTFGVAIGSLLKWYLYDGLGKDQIINEFKRIGLGAIWSKHDLLRQ